MKGCVDLMFTGTTMTLNSSHRIDPKKNTCRSSSEHRRSTASRTRSSSPVTGDVEITATTTTASTPGGSPDAATDMHPTVGGQNSVDIQDDEAVAQQQTEPAAAATTTARRPPLQSSLPAEVTSVPDELVRSFSHSKRVGSYLLGRTIGEGSFAKVKESLHIVTGELVSVYVDIRVRLFGLG